jgi:hypothetical protein
MTWAPSRPAPGPGAAVGPAALLDIGNGDHGPRLRHCFGVVVGADALDVAVAPFGESVGGLHAALGDEDAGVEHAAYLIDTLRACGAVAAWLSAATGQPPA